MWFALIGLGMALGAQPPGSFLTRALTTADGLIGTDVRALTLVSPGELLVGTDVGAQRFDGRRFTPIPAPEGLSSGAIKALYDVDGTTYVVSEGGSWTVREGVATTLDPTPLPGLHAALTQGPYGGVVLADGRGVYAVSVDPPSLKLLYDPAMAPQDLNPRTLLADPDGLWVGAPSGLYRLEDGVLTRRSEGAVRALLADDDGPLVGREDGLFRADGSEVLLYPPCFVTSLARLPDNRVVAGCGDGARIGRPNGAWEEISEASGLPGPVVMSVAADEDGELWLGSFGQGLVRLSYLDVRLWGKESGLLSNRAVLVPGREGVTVATLSGVLRIGQDLAPHPIELPPEASGLFDVLEDAAGQLYGSTYGAIWRLLPGPATKVGETRHGSVILSERPEGIYVADTTDGLLQPVGAARDPITLPEDLLDARLLGTPSGALVGAGIDGLWRLEGTTWARLGDGPGNCHKGETAMDGETLWVACARGVFRRADSAWKAELESPDGTLRDLLIQGGEVWASLADRLVRLEPSRLVIDRVHGLPPIGFTPAAGRGLARLGSWLLASSEAGVLWVRPEAFEREPAPPDPRISALSAGGRPVDPAAIPHDAGVLSVALAADTLSDPAQVAFRFQLDQGDWSDPVNDDRLQLAGLMPGDHALNVQVRRAGGPWSPTPATLTFHIQPAWHERLDVRIGAILALSAIVGLVAYERTRRLRGELRHLRERGEMLRAFGRFVTAEVAEDVLSGRLRTEGERRDVTILFADIRGFTQMSSQMPPQDVVALLNAWFSAMVHEIEAEGGTVNKFMGDALIAVFGAPRPLPDHADRALRAASAISRASERLDVPLKARFGVVVRAGIGVNSGVVAAGPVGSPNRQEYTVYGEAVNVAARVEGLTRTLEADVLVTDETVRRLNQPFHLVHLGAHPLKGVAEPVTIWRLEVARLGDAALQDQIRAARRS